MENLNVPELRAETKTIYVATIEEADSSEYFSNVRLVLQNNPCLQIISIEDLVELRNQGLLITPDMVYAGMVLVNNPYLNVPNSFINAETAAFEIRNWKLHKILDIAGLLGAHNCSYKERRGLEYKRKINADFTVKKAGRVTTDIPINKDDCFRSVMGVDVNGMFPGIDKVTETSYKEAIALAQMTGLDSDPEIDLLLRTRNPNRENRQKEYSYHFNFTQEANTFLDAAFSLSIAGAFDFNANLKSALETKEEIEFSIQFLFP